MATQTPVEATPQGVTNRRTTVIQWGGGTAIASGDVCVADPRAGGAPWKSVQIEGTFNGATVVMQGSNDGVNYETLLDGQGNALSKTSAGLFQIATPCLYLLPAIQGGGASTSLLITVFASRT